ELATRQILHRLERNIEDVTTNHQIVNLASATMQQQVHVAKPTSEQLLDQLEIHEHLPVGDQAEVEPEQGRQQGPVQQLEADGRLATRQHHHRVTEFGSAADLH